MIPLTLLERIPVLGDLIKFAKDKTRLLIEYVLIGIVIVLCAYAISAYIKTVRTERALSDTRIALDETKNRLTVQEQLNGQQDSTIGYLKDTRKKDAEALSGLLHDFKSLTHSDAAARKKVAALESKNEKVRAYLDADVPVDLECLLDDTCAASRGDKDREGHAPK